MAFLCWAAASGRSQAGQQRVEDTRAALSRHLQIQRLLSQEKRDWVLGQQMLRERIEIVRREIEGLRARIADVEKNVAETEAKSSELQQQSQRLHESAAVVKDLVVPLETQILQLLQRLPAPIRERVEPLSQRIPRDPAATPLSLGKRFESLVGVLNEVNRFQSEVHATTEVRQLPNGEMVEVVTLYLGLGHAYYSGRNGSVAGLGQPGPDGWSWIGVDEAATEIARAVAIYKKEGVADFVRLPIRMATREAEVKQR
jgi:hypothetical protein